MQGKEQPLRVIFAPDKSPAIWSGLLDQIHAAHKHFFAEISCDPRAWSTRPQVVPPGPPAPTGRPPSRIHPASDAPAAQRVDQGAYALPRKQWQHCIIHEGTKGPMVVEIASRRMVMVEDGLPGREEWLVIRRPVGKAANCCKSSCRNASLMSSDVS